VIGCRKVYSMHRCQNSSKSEQGAAFDSQGVCHLVGRFEHTTYCAKTHLSWCLVIGYDPRREFTQGWAGALTDWAALGSLTADQAAKYQSAWIPDAALSEPVSDQGTLSWAAPTMLVALAATLSSMQVKAEHIKMFKAISAFCNAHSLMHIDGCPKIR